MYEKTKNKEQGGNIEYTNIYTYTKESFTYLFEMSTTMKLINLQQSILMQKSLLTNFPVGTKSRNTIVHIV